MSKNNAVLVEYAKLIAANDGVQDGIQKYAWTSRDLTKALALEGAISGAVAGGGAIGIGSGGATGLAGALTALVPVGAGAGAGAGAAGVGTAIVSNPVGWIIGAVLLVAGVGSAIYFAVQKTDDNLKDLIERIEALDYEGTKAETRVQSWIDTLTKKSQAFQLPALGAMNDKEKANQLAQKTMEMEDTIRILKQIAADWPETSPYLGDWKFFPFDDPADFEYALKKTYAESVKMLNNIKQKSQEAANQVISSTQKPTLLVTEINSLDTQISNIWGKPEYDREEQKALEVGRRILKKEVNMVEYSNYLPKLVDIRDQLRTLLQVAKRKTKKAGADEDIQKLAVKLPDKPGVKPSTKPSKQLSKRRYITRSDVVESLQNYLNHLNVALNVPSEMLKEDGRYGSKTADALIKTLGVVGKMLPNFFKKLQWQGIPVSRLGDVSFVNNNPGFINYITKEISKVSDAIRSGGPEALKEQQQQTKPISMRTPTTCNWNKQNPTSEEMLACFQQLYGNIGGERVNLYDYAKQNMGMSDDQIFKMLHNKYPGWAPKAWSVPNIIDAIGKKYSIF